MLNATEYTVWPIENNTVTTGIVFFLGTDEIPNSSAVYNVSFNISTNYTDNLTHNVITTYFHVPRYDLPIMVTLCVLFGAMVLSTVVGNVFVISAIILEKSLQGVSNYLILSLAVTDLLVAVLVMPISIVNEISVFWYLGAGLCDMWISFDVLCCTGSILHLVAIAMDRFWAVSNIDYIRRRCARQILIMILIVWVVAVSISIPPLFGWKEANNNPDVTGVCIISQDPVYTIFSTVGAFYFPLGLMLLLNLKIYRAARSRIRKKHFLTRNNKPTVPTITNADGTTRNNSSGSDVSQDNYTVYNGTCVNMNEISRDESNARLTPDEPVLEPVSQGNFLTVPAKMYTCSQQKDTLKSVENNNHHKKIKREREKHRKERIEMKRERKAARVLGIITGAFVACWLPFFLLAVTGPFLPIDFYPPVLFSITLWLGYLNSTINPIIYTIFNPSFRNAFRKLVFGKYRLRRYM